MKFINKIKEAAKHVWNVIKLAGKALKSIAELTCATCEIISNSTSKMVACVSVIVASYFLGYIAADVAFVGLIVYGTCAIIGVVYSRVKAHLETA